MTLKSSQWSDESGEFTVSGEQITLFAEILGEKEEFASGTVKDGRSFGSHTLGRLPTLRFEG